MYIAFYFSINTYKKRKRGTTKVSILQYPNYTFINNKILYMIEKVWPE